MKVVRHEDVPPDEPCIGVRPDISKQAMDFGGGDPGHAILRADGEENDERFSGVRKHTTRWDFSREEKHGKTLWRREGSKCRDEVR